MATSPILLVPYMWIGDFVRCHSVIKLLKARNPDAPVDVLTTSMVAPLLDYMPGVRKGIVVDLPAQAAGAAASTARWRGGCARKATGRRWSCRAPGRRRWRRSWPEFRCAPALSARRRFGLLNDLRWGERALPRMIDQCAALALPKGEALAAGMAAAGTRGAGGRSRRAGGERLGLRRRRPSRGRAGAGRGRPVEALAVGLLCRRWRGGWRPRAYASG